MKSYDDTCLLITISYFLHKCEIKFLFTVSDGGLEAANATWSSYHKIPTCGGVGMATSLSTIRP